MVFDGIASVQNQEEGERFLTGAFPILREQGARIVTSRTDDLDISHGVNDRAGLMEAEELAQRRILEEHARAGVTFLHPSSTRVEVGVQIGVDAVVSPGVSLLGGTTVGEGAAVGPHTTARDSAIGAGASVVHSFLVEAEIQQDALVGPFAYLRPGTVVRARRQGRHVRRGQELRHRRGRQGAAPLLHRRRGRRRRRQPRRQHDHRQLRRPPQAPHQARKEREDRDPHVADRSGRRRGSGVHWCRLDDHRRRPRGRARDRPGEAEEHRGLLGPRRGGPASEHGSRDGDSGGAGQQHHGELREAADDHRRAVQPRAGRQDRRAPRGRPHRRRPQDLRRRRGLLPLRGVHPRCRPVRRPVDLRLRARGPHGQRRALGAPAHDPRGQARLGPPDRRRRPVVRLLAPGQEVGPARADLSPPRRRGARDRGHRSPGDHGPPRRPAAGLLLQAGRPHDRDADPHPVRAGPPRRPRPRDHRPRRRAREAGPQVRAEGRRSLRADGEGAPRSAGRRDRLRDRRREGQDGRHRRRHHRHRRHPERCRADRPRRGRQRGLRRRHPRPLLGPRVRDPQPRARCRASSSPTPSRSTRARPT